MNWNTIQNDWKEYEGDAKLQWSRLSPAQIKATQGQRQHLSARLQEVYAVSPQEAERQIAELAEQADGESGEAGAGARPYT